MRLDHINESLMNEFSWFYGVGLARQAALCDMAYQLGIDGLLKFKKSLKHMESGDYKAAASECLNSRWASQTPKRAAKISIMIANGEFI